MKQFVSLFLSLCLVFTMTVPTYGGEEDSQSLEQAILAVKQVVLIPTDYTEFSYYSYESETNGVKGTVWNLTWSNQEQKGSVYAAVDWNGNLFSYEKYRYNEETGLANISREQAEKAAHEFLEKALPAYASEMIEINQVASIANTYGHVFQYEYQREGVPVPFLQATIRVDKYTGEVASFNWPGQGLEIPAFPDKEGIISIDLAKDLYLEKVGVDLNYHSYYDYEKKVLNVFPAYRLAKGNVAIDAKTGEAVELFNRNSTFYGGMGSAEEKSADGMGGEIGLTKEEQDAVQKLGGLISKEEAALIIKAKASIIPKADKVVGASLRQETIDLETYVWEISFENGYGSVNAKTGEMLSFSFYGNESTGYRNLNEKDAKEIGESFLKTIAPDKYASSNYTEDYESPILYRESSTEQVYYTFHYYRQINGIDYIDNGLTVTVDNKTGNIISYHSTWYDTIQFPAIDQVISAKEMMEIMSPIGGYQLAYEKVGEESKIALVYSFDITFYSSIFNPISGKEMDWRGEPIKDSARPIYSDIDGHWSEEIVLELLANGYYMPGDTFRPNGAISQLEFFRYLYAPEYAYYTDDGFYDMLINMKIITEAEIAPDKNIVRQDAAKFVVRYLGLGLAGKYPDIFNNPFKDKIENGYKGYAALCYALGIMRGDETSKFNGTAVLTRGEAASIIKNSLKAK